MDSIGKQLEDLTARISNFENSRNYVSLSHIHLPVEDIIRQQQKGFDDSIEIRLRCYKGYQMERDLMERIKMLFIDRMTLSPEITCFDGAVKGHPDFLLDGYPADCKTVPLDEHLPAERLPRRVFFQLQSYMLYSHTDKALAIYESRETGRIRDYWTKPVQSIQREIDSKIRQVLNQLIPTI